jgi:hypothetical protein
VKFFFKIIRQSCQFLERQVKEFKGLGFVKQFY